MILDYDPIHGLETSLHFENDEMRVVTTQPHAVVQRILDDNQRLANSWEAKNNPGDLQHYARVPAGVILEWRTKYGVDFYNPAHRKKVFQLLNSREYRKCKVTSMIHAG